MPFRFRGAAVEIDGAPEVGVEGFAVTVVNNLHTGPARAGRAACLLAGRRQVALQVDGIGDCAALNSALRDGRAVGFAAWLGHPSGWSLRLELPVLYLEQNVETAGPDGLVSGSPRFQAGVDADGDDVRYDVLPPGATTTAG